MKVKITNIDEANEVVKELFSTEARVLKCTKLDNNNVQFDIEGAKDPTILVTEDEEITNHIIDTASMNMNW